MLVKLIYQRCLESKQELYGCYMRIVTPTEKEKERMKEIEKEIKELKDDISKLD